MKALKNILVFVAFVIAMQATAEDFFVLGVSERTDARFSADTYSLLPHLGYSSEVALEANPVGPLVVGVHGAYRHVLESIAVLQGIVFRGHESLSAGFGAGVAFPVDDFSLRLKAQAEFSFSRYAGTQLIFAFMEWSIEPSALIPSGIADWLLFRVATPLTIAFKPTSTQFGAGLSLGVAVSPWRIKP